MAPYDETSTVYQTLGLGGMPPPAFMQNGNQGGYRQALTLVHFSAQLEPCMTQENTLHTLTPP
jgi:hypothetical protein